MSQSVLIALDPAKTLKQQKANRLEREHNKMRLSVLKEKGLSDWKSI
jgi:hypothetical protein